MRTMQTMTGIIGEINPCPFCGGTKAIAIYRKGRAYVNGLDHPVEQHKWYVQCTKCRARGPIASGKVNLYENHFISQETRNKFPSWQTTDNELQKLAVRLWNNRYTYFVGVD